MNDKLKVTIVPHTHWDRAWYVTFQEYRARLVRLIDRMIDLLEADPEYSYFMLDGQTSVLEDYLEVRPQRAEKLQALAEAGRISVGPWYVLPDEFLVSPEALIRNLMVGHRMGAAYGGAMKAGYVPDGFGHIGQLPQIFQGFDIDSVFFWRGIGAEADDLGTEFHWQARDGSRVLTIWMPWGYHNLSNVGYPIRWGDTSQMVFDWELALDQIKGALAKLEPLANTPARLLMNGIDHAEAQPQIPELVTLAAEAFPELDVKQGMLFDHLEAVRAAGNALPEFCGEFRWGRYSEILQGVYSTRLYLKQHNHRVETLLERYAEPLTALAWLAGAISPDGTQDLLWTAWRWLLKNHPHDDIYGSGIDPIHEEMLYRFSQAEQIGSVLVRNSLREIARQVDFTGQQGTPILVYNPLNWARSEVATGIIDFEFDDPTAENFVLVNGAGEVVPHQVLDSTEEVWLETLKPNRKRRVTVNMGVSVPPCGYTTVYAQPGSQKAPATDLVLHEHGAENDFMAFYIEPDGSLTVIDRQTGATYSGLHHFEDVDDAGDEYSYCPSPTSETLSSAGEAAQVELVYFVPTMAQYRVTQTLQVPASLTDDRQKRTRERVPLPITSTLTLYAGQPGLYIETHVDNRAKDHKLTVTFDTDLTPDRAYVDAAFQISARDIELPASDGWLEDPTPLMHQRAFTDLSDGDRGLAILNRGLPSVEVGRTPTGTSIALTLLRCVGWLSRDDLSNRRISAGPIVPTPGAQCPGEHTFEYAILPHAGDWTQVYPTAYNYVAPLHVTRADTHEGMELREMPFIGVDEDWYEQVVRRIPWPREGVLSDTHSFLTLEPQGLVLSAVRRSADGGGLIVRCFNLTDETITASLTSALALQAAYLTNLNEERGQALTLENGNRVSFSVKGGAIVTCELRPVLPGT